MLCVLGPALNLPKNACVFPCLDQAIGKTAIQAFSSKRGGEGGPFTVKKRLLFDELP